MRKEKISIELPTSFIEWYKIVANYNNRTLDQTIQEALATDIVS
jgi:chromosome condensin MukBEF complex kleisin-like MukF subunit